MKRPHIIIINPDEMRLDSMGHMGNPTKPTPFLDWFAENEAVSFSNAYCQNPACVPSRCSFFTGLYPHTKGHRSMMHLLHEDESSLFSELKNAGYYVWMNARNDLIAGQIEDLEKKHADEVFYYDKEKARKEIPLEMLKKLQKKQTPKERTQYLHYVGAQERMQNDTDLRDTLAACQRIQNPVDDQKPLCLFLGLHNPHPPYAIQQEYRDRIQTEQVPQRTAYSQTKDKSEMIRKLHGLVGGESFSEEQWQELRAVYLAQCMYVDEMFRIICDALKEAGIYDDSAIFFLSDHGDFTGDYDLPEKAQNTFENCLTKVPLLIKPPKGEAVDPGITDSLTELVDFYATVMDYAGVKPDHTHFGRSLKKTIADRKQQNRKYVFCEGGRNPGETHCDEWHCCGVNGPNKGNDYWAKKTAMKDDIAHEKGTMIFDGRYKYVRRPSGRDEFYDLQEDPFEKINTIKSAEAEKVCELKEAMLDWYQRTCDIVPFSYDSRMTSERLWSIVRDFCPCGEEEKYKNAIKGKDVSEVISICMRMRMAEEKRTE